MFTNRLISYYRARYYSPNLGRFISRDPYIDKNGAGAELTQGPNLYWYVQDNAANQVDPMGLNTNVIVSCRPVDTVSGLAVHCSIVATCPKTGETLQFEILGPSPATEWQDLTGGLPPTKVAPHPPVTPTPPGTTNYDTVCKDDCCKVLECLKKKQASTTPPLYYALWQNSNTYAHQLLTDCGCELPSIPTPAPTSPVDPSSGWNAPFNLKPSSPRSAPGWW